MGPRVSTATLREQMEEILDRVVETGESIEIECHGQILTLAPKAKATKLGQLMRRPVVSGDPEALIHLDWSADWKP